MAERRRHDRRRMDDGCAEDRRRTDRRKGDRRKDLRVPTEVMAQVEATGRRTYRRTANLSRGGLGFDTPIPHGRGDRIHLALQLVNRRRPVRLNAEVVGVNQAGLGTRVRFVDLTRKSKSGLDDHLGLFNAPTKVGGRLKPRSLARFVENKRVREGILIVEGDPQGREFRLRSDDKVIGRDPLSVDFVLPHDSVSRRHAHVYMHNNRHVLADLASTNGTHFRNRPVHSMVLKDGMFFSIGKIRLQYLVTQAV